MKAPIRTAMLFFRRSKVFVQRTNPSGKLPTIKFDRLNPSQEWQEWREYFARHVGQVPVVMQKMIDNAPDRSEEMTVPAKFPQHFDETFKPDPQWKPAPPRLVTAKEHRATLKQMQTRYGPNYGITQTPRGRPPVKPWKPPTDDDLRRQYGRRHDEPDPSPNYDTLEEKRMDLEPATEFSNSAEGVEF
jgi:hypothetical protein